MTAFQLPPTVLSSIAAAVVALASAPAAAQVTLDFEGPTSFASVADFYAGGSDGAGATGPSYGIVFRGDALAFRNDALGPYFSNAPSPLGVLAPVGADSAMNVAAGFTGAVSFFYSATQAVANGVQLWSGLDGTGTLLGSFNLLGNATNGCSDSPFCRFDSTSLSFSGIARSLTFANAVGVSAIDNITVTPIPEPETVALMSLGLAGLAVARRRRRG
jgi:hypothetical protein